MQQITVKELHDNWILDNPHYEFYFQGKKIKSIRKTLEFHDFYAVTLKGNKIVIPHAELFIEVRPKSTETLGVSDLDATLPIIPAETAQRDHDEIQRLRAEKEKMRGLLEGLAKFKDSKNGNLRHFATRAWNLLNRS